MHSSNVMDLKHHKERCREKKRQNNARLQGHENLFPIPKQCILTRFGLGRKREGKAIIHELNKQTESWSQTLGLECLFISKDRVPMALSERQIAGDATILPPKNRDNGGSIGRWRVIGVSPLSYKHNHFHEPCRERKERRRESGIIRPERYVPAFINRHVHERPPQSCLLTLPFCLSRRKYLLPSVRPLAHSFILNMGMYGTSRMKRTHEDKKGPSFLEAHCFFPFRTDPERCTNKKNKVQGLAHYPFFFFVCSLAHAYRPVFSHTVIPREKKKGYSMIIKVGATWKRKIVVSITSIVVTLIHHRHSTLTYFKFYSK